MIRDAWVVGRHEFKTIVKSFLPTPSAIITIVLILALFGIAVPISLVNGWLGTAGYLFLWFWLAWLLIAGPISDSFAGERERHTQEALFASRLPDWAILIGKIAAVTLFGIMASMLALAVSAATTNIYRVVWPSPLLNPGHWLITLVLTPLTVLLATTAGALISLNARTARQAHQTTIVVVPAVILVALALNYIIAMLAPAAHQTLARMIHLLSVQHLELVALVCVMASLTIATYILASARLRRCRVVPA